MTFINVNIPPKLIWKVNQMGNNPVYILSETFSAVPYNNRDAFVQLHSLVGSSYFIPFSKGVVLISFLRDKALSLPRWPNDSKAPVACVLLFFISIVWYGETWKGVGFLESPFPLVLSVLSNGKLHCYRLHRLVIAGSLFRFEI